MGKIGRAGSRLLQSGIAAGFLALLSACASPGDLADDRAAKGQMARAVYNTSRFQIIGYSAIPGGSVRQLTVFIEGDGAPWRGGYPPRDPSPRGATGLELALNARKSAHPGEAIAYLARPCQFVRYQDVQNCRDDALWWTSHRFAPEVIQSMGEAVAGLVRRTAPARLRLVGHSGGGTVAALLAAHAGQPGFPLQKPVDRLVTMAATLDHEAWTRLHGFAPLTGSLNPPDFAAQLASVSQIHYVGGEDDLVPPFVAESYQRRVGGSDNRIELMPDEGHECCWARKTSTLLR